MEVRLAGKGSYLGGSTVVGWGSHGYRAHKAKNQKLSARGRSTYSDLASTTNQKFERPKIATKPKAPKLRKGGPSTLEIKHFSFGGKSLDRVLDDLEPAVWTLQKRGVERPEDVARLLNAAGIRTAFGSEWTPQLALFLLGFIHKRRLEHHSGSQPPKPRALTLEEMGFRIRDPKLIPRSR